MSVGQPAGRGDTNSPIQDNGTAGWIWVLLLAEGERDDCQRHAVHYGRVLIFTQLTQLWASSVVLLLLGDKMEYFLFVLCLQCSEQSGRKRTVHYSA